MTTYETLLRARIADCEYWIAEFRALGAIQLVRLYEEALERNRKRLTS